MTEARPLATHKPGEYVKISKVGAGYVYVPRADYRCRECWKYVPNHEHGNCMEISGNCMEIRSGVVIKPEGYCILWSKGDPFGADPGSGPYRAEQVGYGESRNGTTCARCKHFDGTSRCEIVEGTVAPGGCCNNQEPK